jgi:hypothetical protein
MTNTLHRNLRNLHACARAAEMPPLEQRLRYKFQSTEVTERCTLLAARIFKATGAPGFPTICRSAGFSPISWPAGSTFPISTNMWAAAGAA